MSDFANIEIIDDISSWSPSGSFASVRNAVKAAGKKKLNIVVNGYGGSVFEAVLIYNYLKGKQPNQQVNVHIPAFAMSAHTFIATVGSNVTMADNGYYMIHNPWTMAAGDVNDFSSSLQLLEGMTNQLADAYVAKTNLPKKKIMQMMDAETWLTAQEALDLGFVDQLTQGAQMDASFDRDRLTNFSNTPANILTQNNPTMQEPIVVDQDKSLIDHIKAFFVTKPEASQNPELAQMKASIDALAAEKESLNATILANTAKITELSAEIEQKNTEILALKTPAAAHTEGPTDPKPTVENVPSYLQGAIYDKLNAMSKKKVFNQNQNQ